MAYKIAESVKVEDGKTFIVKERMQDIVWECDGDSSEDYEKYSDDDFAEIVLEELTDIRRWSTHHYCVFKLSGKYYSTNYSKGATEMQDESPYEYDNDWIKVTEVEPKEVTVIKYVPKGSR